MKRNRKPKWLLGVSILSLIFLLSLVVFWEPNAIVLPIITAISSTFILFLLIFSLAWSLISYFFKSYKQGVLIGIFVTAVAILRFYIFFNLFYLILLLALLMAIEYLLK